MNFFMICNKPDMAQFVIDGGVDRIFVDMEIMGKEARQGHLSSVISRHSLDDVRRVRELVPSARLLVRINPIHDGSEKEIEQAIAFGAGILMLPMFRSAHEVRAFVRMVGGRALTNLLVETPQAVDSLAACLAVGGVDEVHIGLNDLHLAYQQDFMFEPLSNGLLDSLADLLKSKGIPFGIGGLARVGEGKLPAEWLLAEHVRLGSSAAILSRTFHREAATLEALKDTMDFPAEVLNLRKAYAQYQQMEAPALASIHQDVCQRIQHIVGDIRKQKQAKACCEALETC